MVILCVAMVALSWGLRLFFGGLEFYKLAYTPTISRLDGLALGGLLSILCIHKRDMLLKYRKWLPYVMGLCLGGAYMLSSQEIAQYAHDLSVTYGLIIFSIMYACLPMYF